MRSAASSRRRLLVSLALWPLAPRAPLASEAVYEATAFEAALKAGGPVAIAFEADWCATCSAQKPAILQLLEQPRFRAMTLFLADYDHDTEIRRRLRVAVQGTVIVFRGGREVARAVGLTQPAALAALLARGLP